MLTSKISLKLLKDGATRNSFYQRICVDKFNMVPHLLHNNVSNDHCWGRQPLLRTRWNAEKLFPKDVLDFLLLQQQAVAIVYWCKFDTVRGVGVVIGGDGGVLVGVVAGVIGVIDFVGFACVGVTGIVGVFFVGLDGIGLDGVGLVGVDVSLVGFGKRGVGVGGVGDVVGV